MSDGKYNFSDNKGLLTISHLWDGAGDLSIKDSQKDNLIGLDTGWQAVIGNMPLSDMGSNPIHPYNYLRSSSIEHPEKQPPQNHVGLIHGDKLKLGTHGNHKNGGVRMIERHKTASRIRPSGKDTFYSRAKSRAGYIVSTD